MKVQFVVRDRRPGVWDWADWGRFDDLESAQAFMAECVAMAETGGPEYPTEFKIVKRTTVITEEDI